MNNYQVDTIIIITPQGLRLTDIIGIYTTSVCRGSINQYGNTVSLEYICDQELVVSFINPQELKVFQL